MLHGREVEFDLGDSVLAEEDVEFDLGDSVLAEEDPLDRHDLVDFVDLVDQHDLVDFVDLHDLVDFVDLHDLVDLVDFVGAEKDLDLEALDHRYFLLGGDSAHLFVKGSPDSIRI